MVFSVLSAIPLWVFFTCLVSIASFACFKRWQMHPLYGKNIGPPILPFLGSFMSLLRNQHRMYEWATELLQRSPSLTIRSVLFGIELHTTANPANVEHMLKTNFHNYTKGYRFHMLMHDMLGDGIFNADAELWRAQRKAASYEFTSHSLRNFLLQTVQNEISTRLLPVLYSHIHAGPSSDENYDDCKRSSSSSSITTIHTPSPSNYDNNYCKQSSITSTNYAIDLQDIFLRFAFDNVCQISLGVDPACLNPSLQSVAFAKAFDDATELIIQRFFTPAWVWKLKRALDVGSERKLRKALHIVHSFAMEVIRKRKQEYRIGNINQKGGNNDHRRSDLLFRFISVAQMHELQSGQSTLEYGRKVWEDKPALVYNYTEVDEALDGDAEKKSDELLRDMIISFLLAGRDTSSIGLSWFFWLLIMHPRVEAAIYEEITRVLQARNQSWENAYAKETSCHDHKLYPFNATKGMAKDSHNDHEYPHDDQQQQYQINLNPQHDAHDGQPKINQSVQNCDHEQIHLNQGKDHHDYYQNGHINTDLDYEGAVDRINENPDHEHGQMRFNKLGDANSQHELQVEGKLKLNEGRVDDGDDNHDNGQRDEGGVDGYNDEEQMNLKDNYGDDNVNQRQYGGAQKMKQVKEGGDGQKKLNEGVEDDGKMKVDGGESFTYEELKGMHYLHAAIHEAVRLYPPVPHDTKLAVAGDVLPDGTPVCANAQVTYHPYAMARMEGIWGPDCLAFRPERWLGTCGTFVQASPFKFPVFQAGPRTCLGKDMAIVQMKCVAAALIQRFTFSLPQEDGSFRPRYGLSFTLKMQNGLPVHVHPRPLPFI